MRLRSESGSLVVTESAFRLNMENIGRLVCCGGEDFCGIGEVGGVELSGPSENIVDGISGLDVGNAYISRVGVYKSVAIDFLGVDGGTEDSSRGGFELSGASEFMAGNPLGLLVGSASAESTVSTVSSSPSVITSALTRRRFVAGSSS